MAASLIVAWVFKANFTQFTNYLGGWRAG